MNAEELSSPKNCSYYKNDWELLSNFWHPIAFSDDIKNDKSYATVLLDVPLVAYRTSSGITVAKNVCPHRGAKLSDGRMADNAIACPYHGFEYGSDGQCQKTPFAKEGTKVPERLCLQTFMFKEKYRLIFVCLSGNPVAPLPVFKDFDEGRDKDMQKIVLPVLDLKASAGRHTENFNDVAHLSFVHQGTFGASEHAYVADYKAEQHEHAVSFMTCHVQSANTDLSVESENVEVRRNHLVQYPHAASFHLTQPNGNQQIIFDLASPVSASRCRIFIIEIKNFDLHQTDEEWINFEMAVAEQDRGIVEGLQPVTVPTDLNDEFHVTVDAFSVAYRRKWHEYGLGN